MAVRGSISSRWPCQSNSFLLGPLLDPHTSLSLASCLLLTTPPSPPPLATMFSISALQAKTRPLPPMATVTPANYNVPTPAVPTLGTMLPTATSGPAAGASAPSGKPNVTALLAHLPPAALRKVSAFVSALSAHLPATNPDSEPCRRVLQLAYWDMVADYDLARAQACAAFRRGLAERDAAREREKLAGSGKAAAARDCFMTRFAKRIGGGGAADDTTTASAETDEDPNESARVSSIRRWCAQVRRACREGCESVCNSGNASAAGTGTHTSPATSTTALLPPTSDATLAVGEKSDGVSGPLPSEEPCAERPSAHLKRSCSASGDECEYAAGPCTSNGEDRSRDC